MTYPETVNELIKELKNYNDYEKEHEYDFYCDFILGATLALETAGLIDCSEAGTRPEEEVWEDSWSFTITAATCRRQQLLRSATTLAISMKYSSQPGLFC